MKKLKCHCGEVEAEINVPDNLEKVLKCNCSICKRKGAIMSMVKNEDFKIVKGKDKLKLYSNAQVEKILTARTQRTQRTNRTNCTNRTQRTQRISSARIQSETARLQASKEELQNQLFAISSKLKTAMTKPEPDQPLTVESINAVIHSTIYSINRIFNQ